MSASLVGSEMCIRDSADHPCNRKVCKVAISHKRLALAAPMMARRMIPVSYTHLTLPTICSV
eukprot:9975084-Alexandrium_andersonii.AAC.1